MARRHLFLVGALVAAGCASPSGSASDAGGGRSDARGEAGQGPTAKILLEYDYLTIRAGQGYHFRGQVACAGEWAPCSYAWDFGDGQTSDKLDPGVVTFKTPGFRAVTFTATSAKGAKHTARAHVAVWEGEFKDSFNRGAFDWDATGWRRPEREVKWSIEGGMAACQGDLALPGSAAITPWPEARDVHLEVTVKRQKNDKADHWSDIILRMHPLTRTKSFYRVRIWEEPAPGSGLELAIFKIEEGTPEHGFLIGDPAQPWSVKATQCKQCPYAAAYPRTSDIRVTIDLKGPEFQVALTNPDLPGPPVLTQTVKDASPNPHLYAGHVGLTHFEGLTYFDDFVFKSLDP
ncbi:MAG: hypothetical protein IT371_13685 [Deltaproteobacteria bacterium]|nr:hypothetical protein [Deltaproteobacteria bacterium]